MKRRRAGARGQQEGGQEHDEHGKAQDRGILERAARSSRGLLAGLEAAAHHQVVLPEAVIVDALRTPIGRTVNWGRASWNVNCCIEGGFGWRWGPLSPPHSVG